MPSGCVVECRICNWEVAGSNLGRGYFAVYSAFYPSGVGKWVPATAGKAKAGMAHSDCGWTCRCAGKTVKSFDYTCHTWALLRWWFTTKRRYIKCMHLPLPFTKPLYSVRSYRVRRCSGQCGNVFRSGKVLLRCVWSAAREALGAHGGEEGHTKGAYCVATRTLCYECLVLSI